MAVDPIPCLGGRREVAYLINRTVCPFGLDIPNRAIRRSVLSHLEDGPRRIGIGGTHPWSLRVLECSPHLPRRPFLPVRPQRRGHEIGENDRDFFCDPQGQFGPDRLLASPPVHLGAVVLEDHERA